MSSTRSGAQIASHAFATAMASRNTLLGLLAPPADLARLATIIGAVVLGSLLLTLSAKISVPVWPIPVTLQSFAVAVLAAAFGWRVGVASVVLYLLEGMAGLPVFASGGGAAYLLGPSGGFLLGFIPMAYVIGRAADAGASGRPLVLFAAMVAGGLVLFAVGFSWLLAFGADAAWLDKSNLVGSAFAAAVQPFIIWDVLKMGFAAATVAGLWSLVRTRPPAP